MKIASINAPNFNNYSRNPYCKSPVKTGCCDTFVKSCPSFSGGLAVWQKENNVLNSGFNFYRDVEIKDKYGVSCPAHAYYRKVKDYVEIFIADKDFDEVGYLFADSSDGFSYDCSLNNYRNVYDEKYCVCRSPVENCTNFDKKYKGVGQALYSVLIKYLNENYPNIKFITATAVREGSAKMHEKLGFERFMNGHDANNNQTKIKFYRLKIGEITPLDTISYIANDKKLCVKNYDEINGKQKQISLINPLKKLVGQKGACAYLFPHYDDNGVFDKIYFLDKEKREIEIYDIFAHLIKSYGLNA